jgi:hypothetical protein
LLVYADGLSWLFFFFFFFSSSSSSSSSCSSSDPRSWNGDVIEQPGLLAIPGRADKRNLRPLYDEVNAAIRSVDQDHIVFFEPIVTDYYWATGLQSGPGGKAGGPNQVYSYHIYCQLLDPSGQPINIEFCNKTDLIQYSVKQRDLTRLKTAGMMTEFGSSNASPISQESLTFVTDQADRTLQSWAYWVCADVWFRVLFVVVLIPVVLVWSVWSVSVCLRMEFLCHLVTMCGLCM